MSQFEDLKMRARTKTLVSFATCGLLLQLGFAHAATVVALGASNTAGKGVSPSQGYLAAKRNVSRQAAPARRRTPYPGRLPSARAATGRPGCQNAKKIVQTASGWLLTIDPAALRVSRK